MELMVNVPLYIQYLYPYLPQTISSTPTTLTHAPPVTLHTHVHAGEINHAVSGRSRLV
jgi:hypothetical protein